MKRLITLTLMLSTGCVDHTEVAGLTGPNPVVKIEFSEVWLEPGVDLKYSLSRNGVLLFSKRSLDETVIAHHRQLGRASFVEVVSALADFRVPAGKRRTLATECSSWMSDVGSQSVTWFYTNGQKSKVVMTNCTNDETRVLGATLVASRKLLELDDWRY